MPARADERSFFLWEKIQERFAHRSDCVLGLSPVWPHYGEKENGGDAGMDGGLGHHRPFGSGWGVCSWTLVATLPTSGSCAPQESDLPSGWRVFLKANFCTGVIRHGPKHPLLATEIPQFVGENKNKSTQR